MLRAPPSEAAAAAQLPTLRVLTTSAAFHGGHAFITPFYDFQSPAEARFGRARIAGRTGEGRILTQFDSVGCATCCATLQWQPMPSKSSVRSTCRLSGLDRKWPAHGKVDAVDPLLTPNRKDDARHRVS